jgi:hypothetical protein
VGGPNLFLAIATQVAVAKIIREDEDDVRFAQPVAEPLVERQFLVLCRIPIGESGKEKTETQNG